MKCGKQSIILIIFFCFAQQTAAASRLNCFFFFGKYNEASHINIHQWITSIRKKQHEISVFVRWEVIKTRIVPIVDLYIKKRTVIACTTFRWTIGIEWFLERVHSTVLLVCLYDCNEKTDKSLYRKVNTANNNRRTHTHTNTHDCCGDSSSILDFSMFFNLFTFGPHIRCI